LALQHPGGGDRAAKRPWTAVERGPLMRVFPVTQVLLLVQLRRQQLIEAVVLVPQTLLQVACHRGVVARGVRERLGREARAGIDGSPAPTVDLRQYRRVVGRV